jgi:hypothetical protein
LLRISGCLPWHLGTGFVSGCIDLPGEDLYRCTNAWTDDRRTACTAARQPASVEASSGSWFGARIRDAGLDVSLEPAGLRIDVRHTHAATIAPRARELAGGAAEVGDHLTAAAAGHTLPRPMRRRCLPLAVAVLACHDPIRLALRA